VLIVWSIFLKAPLEQPANPANTPNPSKAPWYFLGLQEMLVYFDPVAGRRRAARPDHRRPDLHPYVDKNPKGTATTRSRSGRPEITIFLFGSSCCGRR
jgi:hypothetical protein